jgi:hypothetical protein
LAPATALGCCGTGGGDGAFSGCFLLKQSPMAAYSWLARGRVEQEMERIRSELEGVELVYICRSWGRAIGELVTRSVYCGLTAEARFEIVSGWFGFARDVRVHA